MKTTIAFIFALASVTSIYGQNIEASGIFASSSSQKFKNSFGYSLGYSLDIKSKNKLGFSFSQYFYNTEYDNIQSPEYDPTSSTITKTNPKNRRYALKANYVFGLVNHPKLKLYFGPEIGLNYFRINESYERIATGDIEGEFYTSDYTLNNRFGLGCLLEFRIDEIVSKRISAVLSVNPEITSFEKAGTSGSADPYFIGWLNFNLGIRYNLKKEKKE